MPTIIHTQWIEAPAEVCFDFARDVDVHTSTLEQTNEKAIAGVMTGVMEQGDGVTWEAVHLGVRQRLTAKITSMDPPYEFVDVMVEGAFHSFTHWHKFKERNETSGKGRWANCNLNDGPETVAGELLANGLFRAVINKGLCHPSSCSEDD